MSKRDRDRKLYTILLIICIVGFWLFENFYTPDTYSSKADDHSKSSVPSYFLPSSTTGVVIDHDHYTLSYNEDYEQAEWVAYKLKKSHLTSDNRQRPDFIEDPYVPTKSADWRNYRGSGYDRGHLCPAGDRRFSELAYRETFYTSNISPQDNDFNAGIWNELEMQVRIWTKKYGELFIATGGILEFGLPAIGEEDVAVPRWYYKIVSRGAKNDLKAIAFLIPHRPSEKSLERYMVTIDRVEEMTGIDFMAELPDRIEDNIEDQVEKSDWRLTAIH
ncbi:MAG: DNA/RNA non-specific endonuclease [Flavobacteriaceae bacterium]